MTNLYKMFEDAKEKQGNILKELEPLRAEEERLMKEIEPIEKKLREAREEIADIEKKRDLAGISKTIAILSKGLAGSKSLNAEPGEYKAETK